MELCIIYVASNYEAFVCHKRIHVLLANWDAISKTLLDTIPEHLPKPLSTEGQTCVQARIYDFINARLHHLNLSPHEIVPYLASDPHGMTSLESTLNNHSIITILHAQLKPVWPLCLSMNRLDLFGLLIVRYVTNNQNAG